MLITVHYEVDRLAHSRYIIVDCFTLHVSVCTLLPTTFTYTMHKQYGAECNRSQAKVFPQRHVQLAAAAGASGTWRPEADGPDRRVHVSTC